MKRIGYLQKNTPSKLSPIDSQMHRLIKASHPTCSSHVLLANGELFFSSLPIQARFRYLVSRRGVRCCAADWPTVDSQRLGLGISARRNHKAQANLQALDCCQLGAALLDHT